MNPHKITLLVLTLLLSLALVVPAFAGGWAVVTLEEIPANVVAGEPLTVRFAVRQHGKTLLGGLTATIKAENPATRESVEVIAKETKDVGRYEANITLPSEGIWRWTIDAFGIEHPMPDLAVNAAAASAQSYSKAPVSANPASPVAYASSPASLPLTGIGLGLLGLLGIALAVFLIYTRRTPWGIALLVGGLLVAGFGLVSAATGSPQVVPQVPVTATPDPELSQVEVGAALFVAKGCASCHVNRKIESRFTTGRIIGDDYAPDLTDRTFAPEYLLTFLKDPAEIKGPQVKMPNLELSEVEMLALIAFINSE